MLPGGGLIPTTPVPRSAYLCVCACRGERLPGNDQSQAATTCGNR